MMIIVYFIYNLILNILVEVYNYVKHHLTVCLVIEIVDVNIVNDEKNWVCMSGGKQA